MPVIAIKEIKALLPKKSRLLGIDQGEKTLGLALSNPELTMATPLKTLKRTKFKQDIVEMAKICIEYNVLGFVIGLPLNMDGSEGPRVQSVKHFSDNLLNAKNILGFDPLIAFFDERLSTYAAEQLLIDDLGMSRDKRKAVIDAAAAACILQGALDSLKRT